MKEKLYQIPFSPIIQWCLLLLFSLSLHYSEQINNFFDNQFKNYSEDTRNVFKYIIFTIPLITIFILDMLFHSFSMNNLLVTKIIPNDYFNYLLLVIGLYGIVQVISQDFGIKTGLKQNRFTKNNVIHFFVMFGSAFAVSGKRSESFLAALLYIFLRKLISNNKTIDACFEDV